MKYSPVKSLDLIIILHVALIVFHAENSTGQSVNDSISARTLTPDTTNYFSGDKDLNLCTAAYDGNDSAVLALLNMGASMNYYNDGLTALQYAILNDHLSIAKILILNGADINLISSEGETPLLLAVRNEHDEIADYLCQQGAAIDSTDYLHRTSLMFAVANGSFYLEDMLLYYGANPSLKDIDGNDALMIACYTNQPELASDLHKYGADVNTTDKEKNTPLIVAAEKSYNEIIDSLLLWGADPSKKNSFGYNALAKCVSANSPSTVKILLSKSTITNENIRPGIKPLDLAKNFPLIDSLLRSAGARHSIFPDYHEMLFGFDFSSNFSDYMNSVHVGLYDPKYLTSLRVGFHTRMAAMKLYVPVSETIWYQYWERRYFIWAGLDKLFPIFHSKNKTISGLSVGFKGGYTFGNYRGSSTDAAAEWLIVPAVQLFQSGRYHTISLGYEYAKYPCFELGPSHLTASLRFHFPLKKVTRNSKSIDWIQTNP
jgi:ankyrin repeat protein